MKTNAQDNALKALLYEHQGRWAIAAEYWRRAGLHLNAKRCEEMIR